MKKNSRLIVNHIATWLSVVFIVFIVVNQGAIQSLRLSVHPDRSIELEASFGNKQQ